MVSAKRLSQMIWKWQRVAAIGRKRLMWTSAKEVDECCTSVAVKGHCTMYTADGRRFEVPLAYLSTPIIGELLRMSQDEFGFTSDGRITLPCDAAVMDYIMCLLRRNASEEVERAFLSSMHIFLAKRLSQMIKKWQRVAAIGRKRLMWTSAKEVDECCTSVAVKGHCAMYTADGRRFEVPLAYLSTPIIGELLRMSQDEFGFTSDGRITLPCDAAVMDYVMCLLRRNASEEVERAFLSSVVRPCQYASGLEPSMGVSQQVAVSGF
ncbi:unnamed protein product [Triticum turgidum subsp. durum]|uniref:Auxin-responsive protein n=1 Tax=Triticum turgidum subsp. durum TaxID=4567 RepID=A0A9R0XFA3_TRITD|nr:unnamed protein product [Triticum turgidum subsp. durum]